MQESPFRDNFGTVLEFGDEVYYFYARDNSATVVKRFIVGFTAHRVRVANDPLATTGGCVTSSSLIKVHK